MHAAQKPLHGRVSIPQAVGTVATNMEKKLTSICAGNVSIPQAVGTVATEYVKQYNYKFCPVGFNTASGRYCCN